MEGWAKRIGEAVFKPLDVHTVPYVPFLGQSTFACSVLLLPDNVYISWGLGIPAQI
jgi:hypothetical protein